jgi:outer membrane protein assembly factor BamB
LRLALGLLGLVACAPPAFSPHARDNDPADLARALGRMTAASSAPGRPMAFLVTASDRELVAYDLAERRLRWRQRADVRSRVSVGHGRVAYQSGDHALAVRAADDGTLRFSVALGVGESLIGMALDDERLYYAAQVGGEEGRAAVVVAVDAAGKPCWRVRAEGALGALAARDGLLAVPFAHQDLVLLDGASGRELARQRASDDEISFARALPEGLYYGGGRGLHRLDATATGRPALAVKLPGDEVRAAYFWDGYRAEQLDYSALDRNRLLWRGAPAGFADAAVVLYSYRYLFALDAKSGQLRWAFVHPRTELIGCEHTGPAIACASVDGDIVLVDARSGVAGAASPTGLRLAGVTFDADGAALAAATPPPSLATTLEAIVWDRDARFMPVKLFAATALAQGSDVASAAALIKMVQADGLAPELCRRAGESLVARHDAEAVPLLRAALALRSDFLADRQARGVAPLARALAARGAVEGASEIAAHLADPQTPAAALLDLTSALVVLAKLGSGEAVRALATLLVDYHADPLFLADPAPLTSAATLLLEHGGEEEKRLVARIATDPRTLPPLARVLKNQEQE